MSKFDVTTEPVLQCLPPESRDERDDLVSEPSSVSEPLPMPKPAESEKTKDESLLRKAAGFIQDLNHLSWSKRLKLAWNVTRVIPAVFGEFGRQVQKEAQKNPEAAFASAVGTGFVIGGPPGALLVGGSTLAGCGGILEWDLDHDEDNDGFTYDEGGDCNDRDPKIHPEATEIRFDQVDQNCNGFDDEDQDGDGHSILEADCEDEDPTVFPNAIEFRDLADNDCDTDIDEPNLLDEAPFCFAGESAGNALGSEVAGGDLNGDGLSDLSLGAPGAVGLEPQSGRIYLTAGAPDWQERRTLADADEEILGIHSADGLGVAMATGDFDGDGIQDLAVSAGQSNAAGTASGAVGLFLGHALDADKTFDAADLIWTGSNSHAQAGASLSFAGDINQDGFEDLLIGAPENNNNQGSVYLILGSDESQHESDLAASADLILDGEETGEQFGFSHSGGADFNGDGFDDFVIGVPGYSRDGKVAGGAHLFLGNEDGPAQIPAAIFYGENDYDQAGYSVSLLPDTDGDDLAELLIGAPWHDGDISQSGKAYLIHGSRQVESRSLAQSDLAVTGSKEESKLGFSTASLGDINGDHLGDWVLSSLHNGSQDNPGVISLFLGGRKFSADVTGSEADALFVGPASGYATVVQGIGDFDGQRYPDSARHDDFAIGIPGVDEKAGAACLYFGQETRFEF